MSRGPQNLQPTQPRSPTTQPPATVADYDTIATMVYNSLPPAEKEKIDKKRAKMRENVIPTCVKLYAANIFNGMSARRACCAAGIDINREWGLITAARHVDPVYNAVARVADAVQRDRIREKALGVVEDTLDGEETGRMQARIAAELVIERGLKRPEDQRQASGGGSPQVIINMPPISNLRCNSVATDGATVFTAKIVE